MANSYGNVSVVSTAGGTEILAALADRHHVIIQNNGTAIIYVGFDSSVTTSNGMPVLPQGSIEITYLNRGRKAGLRAIAASGTQDVRYMVWDQ